MPPGSTKALGDAASSVIWTSSPTEVLPGMFLTGEIPRKTAYEDTGGRFFLDAACTRPDPLLDDQALYFDTREGTVVVLGCGHAGVVNTIERILELTGGKPIHALIGGMHLLSASPDRMDRTLQALRNWNIKKLYPAHCTGMAAVTKLWNAFPQGCAMCPVGTSLVFSRE
jgi:7,8-dihydropterin-6-yl-methyl-4-(beta-D-ribofuranosyl)aminobenzene 5'-phosphate synthase